MKLIEKLDILSLLFSKPDDFIKERIKDKSLGEMLEMAFPQISFSEFLDDNYTKTLLEKIDKDYLYLFVGVSKPLASPYESSYYRKEARLMDKPARDIIRVMKKWGLELEENYKDLPDHIVSKLALNSFLLNYKEEVDEELLKKEIDKDLKKLNKDLGWISEFRKKIQENEEVVFYSKLAKALEDTMREI